jgi:ABC-type phosphate transport system substrate-binding protein
VTTLSRTALLPLLMAAALVHGTSAADVVAVVSAKSTVGTLSKSQVADIFLGRVNRFPDGAAAIPIDQPEGSDTRNQFYEIFAGKSPAQIKAFWSKIVFTGRGQPPKAVADGAELKRLIAANPTAIGYIEASQVDSTVRALP